MWTSKLAKDPCSDNAFCLKLSLDIKDQVSNLKMILEFVPDLLGGLNIWLRKDFKAIKVKWNHFEVFF